MTYKKIGFVTDSTSDIPSDLAKKWAIGIVSVYANYGGRSYADDGVELSREDFYNQIASMRPHPTTAAPSPAVAEKVIQDIAADADHVVILTAPANLSGIHNSLRLGAGDLLPERATLIDSGTVTMGLGWQVIAGAEAAAEGGDLEKVLDAIKRMREHQKLYAAPSSLEYLQRSGRVGWAAASIGALLQIKPVLQVKDGDVEAIQRVRTFRRAMQQLVTYAREEAPLDRLAILHTNNLEGVEELKQEIIDIVPENLLVINITPVIGAHFGPGGLGIVTVRKSWKE